MMDELDRHRLRTFAETGKIITDGHALQRSVARLLALYESMALAAIRNPPVMVRAVQYTDDERWRGAGHNAPLDRAMWEGIARDIGQQAMANATATVRAGSGLVAFAAEVQLVRPEPVLEAQIMPAGGFTVRVVSDNRETEPPAETVSASAVDATQAEWPELKDTGPLATRAPEGDETP